MPAAHFTEPTTSYWQTLLAPGAVARPDPPWQFAYPAVLPDGRVLKLPIRAPAATPDHAVASLLLNQASLAVVDTLGEMLAASVAGLGATRVVGLPTLGLTLASVVARELGHARYLPMGYSRKFWYDEALSAPVSSITSPTPGKRIYLDPHLLPLLAGQPVLLVDDAVSTGTTLLAAYADGADVVQLQHARSACAEEGIGPGVTFEGPSVPSSAVQPVGDTRRWRPIGMAVALGLMGVAGGWWLGRQAPQQMHATVPAAATLSAASQPVAVVVAPTPAAVTPAAVSAPAAATAAASGIAIPPAPPAMPADSPIAIASTPTPVAQIIARTEALIASRAGKGFTIQVLALKAPQPAQLEDYLARFEREAGAVLPVLANDRLYGGIPHHAVYVGEFETREQAQSAMDSLPASLKARGPLIRSFARLAKEPRP